MDRINVAKKLLKLADELSKSNLPIREVAEYINVNQNATKGELEDWADKNDISEHDLEASIIKMATTYSMFLCNGRSNEKEMSDNDVPIDALEKGIDVEYEHTTDKETAKRIALDHLAESVEYYDALEKMEKELEKKKED